ncbi:chondroitin proteoglycan 2-like [Sabethes cyaneus]|uniref:chondroitin proteoglycan 2-like n=1 Tax=Sabethes cyaneus TaxID=53552 RepID=UPI00237DB63C|nr:chondroitin proteoglycan 2-like [Sabethes cyaneus]
MVALWVLGIIIGSSICTAVGNFNYFEIRDRDVTTIDCISSSVSNVWELQPYPNNCRWYIFCMNNIGVIRECPDELYFNPVTKSCDFAENVDCIEPTTVTTEEVTTETSDDGELTTTTSDDDSTESTVTQTTDDDTTVEGTTEETETTETSDDGETTADITITETTNDDTTVEETTETGDDGEVTTDVTITETTNDDTTVEETTETGDDGEGTTDVTTAETTNDDTTVQETTETGDNGEGTNEETTTQQETTADDDCEPLCLTSLGAGDEVADPQDCGRFIACDDQCYGATMFCPQGLHFNHLKKVCDIPDRAECLLNVCVGREDGLFASVNSCRHFYACIIQNGLLTSCASGQVFDPVERHCVVEDEDNVCLPQEIPPPPAELEAECHQVVISQNLPHPNFCDVYFRCVAGTLFPRRCQEGLLFDQQTQFCNWAQLVNCPV